MKNLIRNILKEGDFDWVNDVLINDAPPSSGKWVIYFDGHEEWDEIQKWLFKNDWEWASGFGQGYLDFDDEKLFFHDDYHTPTEFDAKMLSRWQFDDENFEVYEWANSSLDRINENNFDWVSDVPEVDLGEFLDCGRMVGFYFIPRITLEEYESQVLPHILHQEPHLKDKLVPNHEQHDEGIDHVEIVLGDDIRGGIVDWTAERFDWNPCWYDGRKVFKI